MGTEEEKTRWQKFWGWFGPVLLVLILLGMFKCSAKSVTDLSSHVAEAYDLAQTIEPKLQTYYEKNGTLPKDVLDAQRMTGCFEFKYANHQPLWEYKGAELSRLPTGSYLFPWPATRSPSIPTSTYCATRHAASKVSRTECLWYGGKEFETLEGAETAHRQLKSGELKLPETKILNILANSRDFRLLAHGMVVDASVIRDGFNVARIPTTTSLVSIEKDGYETLDSVSVIKGRRHPRIVLLVDLVQKGTDCFAGYHEQPRSYYYDAGHRHSASDCTCGSKYWDRVFVSSVDQDQITVSGISATNIPGDNAWGSWGIGKEPLGNDDPYFPPWRRDIGTWAIKNGQLKWSCADWGSHKKYQPANCSYD